MEKMKIKTQPQQQVLYNRRGRGNIRERAFDKIYAPYNGGNENIAIKIEGIYCALAAREKLFQSAYKFQKIPKERTKHCTT